MSDVCSRCQHADCCMERGDVLPLGMTARWPDGTVYVPRAEAQAAHDACERARDEARAIAEAIKSPQAEPETVVDPVAQALAAVAAVLRRT